MDRMSGSHWAVRRLEQSGDMVHIRHPTGVLTGFIRRQYIFSTDWHMQQDGIPYENLSEERKAFLKITLQKDLRKNTYDPVSQYTYSI